MRVGGWVRGGGAGEGRFGVLLGVRAAAGVTDAAAERGGVVLGRWAICGEGGGAVWGGGGGAGAAGRGVWGAGRGVVADGRVGWGRAD